MDVRILIATHIKPYRKIKEPCYQYVGCGPRKHSLSVDLYDDSSDGDNIAEKNAYYSELSVQYWAWKNVDSPYVGLMHYRRWLVNEKKKLYSETDLKKKLSEKDVWVVKKVTWEQNVKDNYALYRDPAELDDTRAVLEKLFPDYLDAYDRVLASYSLHPYNMLITSKKVFDCYSEFLFAVLFDLEKQYGNSRARLYGYVSERLLDVFMTAHPEYSVGEMDLLLVKEPLLRRIAKRFHKK